ncbi:hypothetical protein PTKIN_Ptkin18bG0105000 [Pterospermum kingtungense]
MIPRCKVWDRELIEELFDERDVQAILGILLHPAWFKDRLVWNYSSNGIYSSRVPPKVQVCLWRACRDVLPTSWKLRSKGVDVPSSCLFCDDMIDTCWHLFVSCSFASTCWRSVGLLEAVETAARVSDGYREWFFKLGSSLSELSHGKFFMIQWRQRNDQLWRGSHLGGDRTVLMAMECLCDWLNVRSRNPFATDETNGVGIGLVVRDHIGSFIAAKTCYYPGIGKAEEIEAIGLLEAVQWLVT